MLKINKNIFIKLSEIIKEIKLYCKIAFFLNHHKKIISKNSILVVQFLESSFGHEFTYTDIVSRVYFPQKITLIYVAGNRFGNYYILDLFKNIDVVKFDNIEHGLKEIKGNKIKETFISVLSLFKFFGVWKNIDIINPRNFYGALSLSNNNLYRGDEECKNLKRYYDFTGYFRAVKDEIGERPKLKKELVTLCKNEIKKLYPNFFLKEFAVLHLREKSRIRNYGEEIREVGDQNEYYGAIKYLCNNGFNVVGSGETNSSIFKNIKGYYEFDSINVSQKLLNIYLLTECSLFIGQHSGPLALPNSKNIPCIITDVLPHCVGAMAPRENSILLFKHLINCKTGIEINLKEIFTDHKDLVFGYNYDKKNIRIGPCKNDELLEAVKEMILLIKNDFSYDSQTKILSEKFFNSLDNRMWNYYTKTRPAKYILELNY